MRDTDTDWSRLAEDEPFFGVLTSDAFLARNLTADSVQAFYDSGHAVVADTLADLRRLHPDFRPARILDFGCGVGRLALAMAPHADSVVGVDVAPRMLDRARQRALETGEEKVAFRAALRGGDRFDWINSWIVFQHIPPARGYEILDGLLRHLVPGGMVSLHFTLFRTRPHARAAGRLGTLWTFDGETSRMLVGDDHDPEGSINMYDYDLNRLVAILHTHDVAEMILRATDHGGHHGVQILARRGTREPGLVEPGRRIGFHDGGDGHRLLAGGWSYAEPWGCWSDAEEGRLSIAVAHGRPLVLCVEATAFLAEAAPGQTVDVIVDGTRAAVWDFSQDDPSGVRRAPLPAHGEGVLRHDVRLRPRVPRSPAALGLSGDQRRLGIGLVALWIEPGANGVAHPEP